MKYIYWLVLIVLLPSIAIGQDHPHYTMFMFNKLIYNPAYAGNKNMLTANAAYRNQWSGINGAPRNFNVNIDGPVGSYMKEHRPVSLGLSVNNETLGVTDNTNIMSYYSYRIPIKKTSLSFGLQAGVSIYSAEYSRLNPQQQSDNTLQNNINNAVLPNFGAGVFWSGSNFYVGASVPNLIENYYDKDRKGLTNQTQSARQIRSYYLSGGYIIPITDNFKLEPQVMARYAGNGKYQQPMNVDLNLSLIFFNRLMVGATYRTDESVEAMVHLQATKRLNIGYAYDYTVSGLNGYNNGSHEIVLGFDFVRDVNKYVNPRFIKPF